MLARVLATARTGSERAMLVLIPLNVRYKEK
jgi:hypothetical protein